MYIRGAEEADGTAIAALIINLGYPIPPDGIDHSLQRQLTHPDAVLLVAVSGDCVVGVISLPYP